jgi:hypothetical protein
MTPTLLNRAPNDADCAAAFAAALRRLGACEKCIETELQAIDFVLAARAIDVKFDDLVAVFQAEMRKIGFVVARRWVQ